MLRKCIVAFDPKALQSRRAIDSFAKPRFNKLENLLMTRLNTLNREGSVR